MQTVAVITGEGRKGLEIGGRCEGRGSGRGRER